MTVDLPPAHLRGDRPPARPADIDPEGDPADVPAETPAWLRCRACGHRLARIDDRFSMPGHPPVASFVNPGGFVHEVLTLRAAAGCLHAGPPVRADSWFPGFAWRFALCGGCTGFVGWRYEAVDAVEPSRFWGLRAPSVREA